MTLDPQARAVLAEGEGAPAPWELDVPAARHAHEATAALSGPSEAVAAWEDVELPGGLPARAYAPALADAAPAELPLVVYLHGGGWVVGSLFSYDPLCRALANATGARVLSAAYRLAPEHRFPAAVEDAVAAVRWALDQGAPVAVAGDSAGANLAAVAARRVPGLRGQALVYPATDASLDFGSYRELGEDYGLGAVGMRWYWDHYLGPDGDPADPDASPLRADDLAGAPPALVLTAGYDPLRDEGQAYAERLRAAGVDVTARRYPGQVHGFFRWMGSVDAAREAVDEVGGWLTNVLRRL